MILDYENYDYVHSAQDIWDYFHYVLVCYGEQVSNSSYRAQDSRKDIK